MIAATPEVLARRARVLADGLAGLPADVGLIQGASAIGGGSLPGETLPTTLVALSWRRGTAGELAARLRQAEPAVVARVEHEQVLLDPRTVLPEEDPLLLATLRERLAMGEA
jgi:L-seryl-tRNA(Ser) seleniumtransferase